DHNVGELFDVAAVPQVAHDRPLVVPGLDAAVELGQEDDGYVQLAGEVPDLPHDVADHQRPVLVGVARRFDELRVVDDDQAQVGLLGLDLAGLGPDLADGQPAAVHDFDGQLVQLVVDGRGAR